MIKILFFIETLTGGGAEKVLRDLVNNMNQAQFDITVQTVWPCDGSKYLAPGIHYKAMYSTESKTNHLRYRAEAASGLAYRLHFKDDYDVECAYLEMGPTKVLASSTNKKAKKLAWVHCDLTRAVTDPQSYVKKTTAWYSKFDQIVCVSQSVKAQFDELFQKRFDSTVLYNVVDDATVREKALLPLPEGMNKHGFTVLSVGRLAPPKRFIRLLNVHQQLLEEGIAHNLWILGEGPDRTMLEKYVNDNNLQSTVFMPGFVENPYAFMREADLIACASVYEGYSTFVTESIILGKPIVTTDVSGMRELLGDSDYGMIVDNNDEALYQGMKTMITNTMMRENYAEKASIRSQQFSTNRLVRDTEHYIEELVAK